jgi:hypothetical protein
LTPHDSVKRYPLEWPVGWKRTPRHERRRAPFGTKNTADNRLTIFQATGRLEAEVQRLGGDDATLSTNVSLRMDGRPRSDEQPADVGAAVYFRYKGKATVFACDRFTTVADNIAAIAGHIEALRRVERYGVGSLEQALAGYKALPADTAANWRNVFGFTPDQGVTKQQLRDAFHTASRKAHPDKGGSEEQQSHVNRAHDYAEKDLGFV